MHKVRKAFFRWMNQTETHGLLLVSTHNLLSSFKYRHLLLAMQKWHAFLLTDVKEHSAEAERAAAMKTLFWASFRTYSKGMLKMALQVWLSFVAAARRQDQERLITGLESTTEQLRREAAMKTLFYASFRTYSKGMLKMALQVWLSFVAAARRQDQERLITGLESTTEQLRREAAMKTLYYSSCVSRASEASAKKN
jgi:ribosomal protein L7Ae-like RNA K-turn-binding protein